ncbi:MAG: DUF167 domain-containing protein [Verrucomicrobiae bacterium]|nr:DUF167 domain-containing protein [Verrucomicrobiae bacterium]
MSRRIEVRVKPNSRDETLDEQEDGNWIARIKAPPVDGRANTALISLVARHFDVRKSQVRIRTGASGRLKVVEIVSD